ncbi:VWA domain-containing protein [Mesoflavibacter profundi]|uniref:VWA domain-containing protein n=1 Tax=Mesoflavibacter profundi TaxID=2708110 RepID=A0ABT4RXU2_9FLAO|nr:vWA domain-containing protein [Mesoflavibacter profundi]MDA0176637.1 VWA domain-containing protein [Mesoflavibacter profundi]
MSTQSILLIILAGIIALLLALFQYKYKTKSALKDNALFILLRFITYFGVFLLLINPKFEYNSNYSVKPNLVIAVDNTQSISYLKQQDNAKSILSFLQNNSDLNEKFNIEIYSFSDQIQVLDALEFSKKQTNISTVFRDLNELYKNTVAPTIIITDGNQTLGNDYQYKANQYNQDIYPIILGDTVTYSDLKISQLNVNRYAYLKNKFPLEAILVYNGNDAVVRDFTITQNGKLLFKKQLSFSKEKTSEIINISLPTSTIGVQTFQAQIAPISTEKNKTNNLKNFAIEVIDQKQKIAIVSTVLHPDLGVIKKSIETNEQREVVFLKPNEVLNQLNDIQLVMLYQPNNSFKQLFSALEEQNKNKWVISGLKTDWRFLNSISKNYNLEITSQTEDYQASLNQNYNNFIVDDIDFESFPPLKSNFGTPNFNAPYQTILFKTVSGINTNQPLLATIDVNQRREAILFGENIWKWRAQNYLNSQQFTDFDNFIGKIVQYLASNKRKNRLLIDYKSFYNASDNITINAQFFNKNYEFDANANLTISIKNKESNALINRPLILKNNSYQVDLNGLDAGDYAFTIASSDNISSSGNFQIIAYNVEEQFLNADVTKLQQIATNNNGKAYFVIQKNELLQDLLSNNKYLPILKTNKTTIPLIDWYYLLFIIALSLASEWFIRKYKGLI